MPAFSRPQGGGRQAEGQGAAAESDRQRRLADGGGDQPRAMRPKSQRHHSGQGRLGTRARWPLPCPPCAQAVTGLPRARLRAFRALPGAGPRTRATAKLTSSLRRRHVRFAHCPLTFIQSSSDLPYARANGLTHIRTLRAAPARHVPWGRGLEEPGAPSAGKGSPCFGPWSQRDGNAFMPERHRLCAPSGRGLCPHPALVFIFSVAHRVAWKRTCVAKLDLPLCASALV